jgi:hypothetical protein
MIKEIHSCFAAMIEYLPASLGIEELQGNKRGRWLDKMDLFNRRGKGT